MVLKQNTDWIKVKTRITLSPNTRPDPVAAQIRRVGSLIERDDYTAAEAEALKLLKACPNRPDVHNILGVAYIQLGKKTRAVPHLEFAVKAEPQNSHYLNNLGRLYLDLHLVELALPFLHNALTITPNLTSALLAIGKYYVEVGKAELALPYFERLTKLMQQDDSVKLKLAESLDAFGRSEEANKLHREVHKSGSDPTPSLYYFSRNDPPEGRAALIAEIEELLPRENLTVSQRGTLHTALGFIHEREGNYAVAFSNFDKSNRLQGVDFDIEKYRAWVDSIIRVFTADFFHKRSKIGKPSPLPVLVVGMPRSGTTLTEQMIANHGQAGGAGEQLRIGIFASRFFLSPQRDINQFLPTLNSLGAEGLLEIGGNYIDLLKFHAPKAERVVDKMPHNFQFLGLAALMCPNARIIHCSRNPVDTCLSCFQNPLNDHHSYSRDLTLLGLYYREYKRLMDHWNSVLPVPIYELSYERLTADFENEARKVIEFIGLPWDEACLRFHEAGRTVRTFSRQQVRNPVYKSSVERWRRYEKELQPLLNALGDFALG